MAKKLPGWWVCLGQAVDDLARRYPRSYGATIPASWRDDLETVELLASITHWRRELDEQDCADRVERETELMGFPVSASSARNRNGSGTHTATSGLCASLKRDARRFAPASPEIGD